MKCNIFMQQMELKFCTCDAYVFFPSSSSVECNVQPTIFYLHVNVRGVNWIAIQIWMFLIWNFMKLSLQKSELRFENNRSVKILHENLIMLKKKMYAKKTVCYVAVELLAGASQIQHSASIPTTMLVASWGTDRW